MPSSHASQVPAATSASRSIRSFLHLQNGKGSASATSLPPASVNRLTDEFLRAVSGVGSTHQAGATSGISGSLDEDVVAKMLSDGARSHDAHLQKMSLVATPSSISSSPRMRKVQKSSGSVSPKSPRSSEARVRAAAESTSLPPAPAAAASIAKALAQMQLPKPRTDVHQPQQIPQPVSQPRQESYKQAARAAAPSLSLGDPIPPPPSASRTEDSGGTKARHDISADGALSVLAGLAEIREMKAGSLERSLERESVRRRSSRCAARGSRCLAAGAHQPSCGY
jgi:hypothetical protein